jgi:ribokinase
MRSIKNIVVMGGINMDLVMYVDHLPKPGETVITNNFRNFPGGKGGNQAVTASLLGGQVRYFGKLGDDTFSDVLIKSLGGKRVDCASIYREKSSTAGIAMIWVDQKGQNSIAFTPGANALLTPADVSAHEDLFSSGGILLLTMEIRPETVYAAIRAAKKHGMTVVLDPAPAPTEPFPKDIPPLVDIVKPNESEAEAITGLRVANFSTAEAALLQLRKMGFRTPVITLGEKGALALIQDKSEKIDPVRVQVVDSTAAGDVFSGALTASLYRGDRIRSALDFANKAAALSTTVKGAQTSIPTLEQVLAF